MTTGTGPQIAFCQEGPKMYFPSPREHVDPPLNPSPMYILLFPMNWNLRLPVGKSGVSLTTFIFPTANPPLLDDTARSRQATSFTLPPRDTHSFLMSSVSCPETTGPISNVTVRDFP